MSDYLLFMRRDDEGSKICDIRRVNQAIPLRGGTCAGRGEIPVGEVVFVDRFARRNASARPDRWVVVASVPHYFEGVVVRRDEAERWSELIGLHDGPLPLSWWNIQHPPTAQECPSEALADAR